MTGVKDVPILANMDFIEKVKDELTRLAEEIGLTEEQIEKMLNRTYSSMLISQWKTKRGEKEYRGWQVKAYEDGKLKTLKIRTSEDMREKIERLCSLYKAYKKVLNGYEEAKEIIEG